MNRSTQQENREVVLGFYREVFGKQDLEAITRFAGEDVTVHAPYVGTGLAALEGSVRETFGAGPPLAGEEMPEPAILLVDGDLVVIGFYLPQPDPERPGETYDFFSFDGFRVRDGKLVDRWPSINRSWPIQPNWSGDGEGPSRPAPTADGVDPEAAKALAVGFYREVFDGQDAAAVERYVTDDYLQHCGHYPQGRAGLEDLVGHAFPDGPRPVPEEMTLPPALLLAEGDLVISAGIFDQPDPDDPGATYPYYLYTAYAVRGDKLSEHWSGVIKTAPPAHKG